MNDKIKYWLELAKEDINVAQILLSSGKFLYCGFFCHLAVEKALKAIIERSGETPPKIHNLIRLAELGKLLEKMTEEQAELLEILNPLQLEARYPIYKKNVEINFTSRQCEVMSQQAKELVLWIEQLL